MNKKKRGGIRKSMSPLFVLFHKKINLSDPYEKEMILIKKKNYLPDLTSAQNGSVGGEMVRQMIKRQEEEMSGR